MILSLLGLSVYDTASFYKNSTQYKIKEGDYINSIEALLSSFEEEKFIFLGTKESIQKHKNKFQKLLEKRDVEFKEYSKGDLNDIFIQIMETLIEYKDKEILFDITHSFRDSVIMSVISTIVSQIIYKPTISMIYAKELLEKRENKKQYEYTLVSDEFLNTANIAILLTTFLSTLKLPPLSSKYQIYNILQNFSTHLVSNQFKDIYEIDVVKTLHFIQENKEKLFFISPLLEELENFVKRIQSTQNKKISEKFLFFGELFLEKDYFLHASTYLIEAITYHIGEVFKELNYINFDIDEYKNQTKIVTLLKLNHNLKDFNFPNEYFVDINIEVFNRFYNLREKVANIGHNLAHINIEQNYGDIKKELKEAIKEYKDLVNTKQLYNLDTTTKQKENTLKYQFNNLQRQVDALNKKGSSFVKVDKVFEKYKNSKLRDLTLYNENELRKFCKENEAFYNKLKSAKEKRQLLLS
jgi:predicted HTH domain antitoxin